MEIKILLASIALIWGFHQVEGHLQRSIDPELQKEIDDFVTNVYFSYSNVSKMGLALIQNNGEILYSTGYGMANEEKNIPNSNQTQFLIGSISKSFTSLVVIKHLHEHFPEVEESVLDTPIRKLMPESNFTLNDRFRSEHATFRDLLAHRMCLFRDDLILIAESLVDPTEIAYRQRYNEEICGIRTQFQYNNQMFVMAAELMEQLTNKTFETLMNDLLRDMGMTNSSFAHASDDFGNMPYRTKPYYKMNNVSYPMNLDLMKRIIPHNAAGGLYVPPIDMAKYMQFHLNKGNVNGTQIIPEQVMSWTIKPAITMPGMIFKQNEGDLVGSNYAYGLGLALATLDGWQYNHHNGFMSPYASYMSLFPSQNLGVFTSVNEGPLWLDQSVVHAFIFQLLNGTTADKARNFAMKVIEKDQKLRKMKSEKMVNDLEKVLKENEGNARRKDAEILGKYGSGSSGDAEILEKFNEQTNITQLYVQYGKWYKGWLENLSGNLYRITWDTDIIHEFYSGGDTVGYGYLEVENDTMAFVVPYDGELLYQASFQLGVSLDKLPPIPWSPESCGPE